LQVGRDLEGSGHNIFEDNTPFSAVETEENYEKLQMCQGFAGRNSQWRILFYVYVCVCVCVCVRVRANIIYRKDHIAVVGQ
jgi:hypothetical protein